MVLNVKLTRSAPAKVALHVVLVASDDLRGAGLDRRQLKSLGFEAKVGATLTVPTKDGLVLLVGVGPSRDLDAAALRTAGAAIARSAGANRTAYVDHSTVSAGRVDPAEATEAIALGAILGAYRFLTYKEATTAGLSTLNLQITGDRDKAAVARAGAIAAGVCFARDLVNEPGGTLHAVEFADRASARALDAGLEVRVLGPAQIAEERLAGLLAVNKGSVIEPRLLELTWAPAGARASVALVGKGLTFDSGGLSIKPADAMMTMKNDKGGGAAVVGAMVALPALDIPVKVTAYVPLTDNMTGGDATRPGDIYRARNGLTVEVLNTDAEGRLIMGDVLAMAAEAGPDAIIDLATLTGACLVALGDRIAGVLGNDDALVDRVIEAAAVAGERMWPLPLAAEYRPLIESTVADIKNISAGRWAGTITAALFLEKFVDGVPWAHLDIAGPAFNEGAADGVTPQGGTGFGVRTLITLLEGMSAGAAPEQAQD